MDKFPYKNGKNLHSTELCLGINARQGMEESLEQDAGADSRLSIRRNSYTWGRES
jgi:hypothetical protein